MKTKAIMFDKDGTLMDFGDFWIPITRQAVKEILQETHMKSELSEAILPALGVENSIAAIDGILCSGTYTQIGHIICRILKENGCTWNEEEVCKSTVEAYHRNYPSGKIRPACENLSGVLMRLREQGIKLAVVTTDDMPMTQKCLQALGIESFFSCIYTDNGEFPTKPDPYCVHDFCKKENLSLSEVVMVGDTLTDAEFARNSGIKSIGIACDEKNIQILEKEVDVVINDISHIFEVLSGKATE